MEYASKSISFSLENSFFSCKKFTDTEKDFSVTLVDVYRDKLKYSLEPKILSHISS